MQQLTQFYPVICTDQGAGLVTFLQDQFGFQPVYSSDWYWHLTMVNQPQVNVALVQSDHASVPEAYRQPVRGLILNIEMQGVADYYERHRQSWDIVLPLRDEPWGQRHFIISTPVAGLLVDVIEIIPPSEEFAAHYHDDLATTD